MEIPSDRLDPDTLVAIAREFVLTEGTDYGHRDWTLDEKVAQVLAWLKSGSAKVDFDPASETCSIKPVSP
jgi:uncharacterized protein YheU (UPF0270 family)